MKSERPRTAWPTETIVDAGFDRVGADRRADHRGVVFYARPRDICFAAKHPLRVDLVIVPDRPAADKAAAGVADTKIGPPSADMSADIEASPVVEQRRRWRP